MPVTHPFDVLREGNLYNEDAECRRRVDLRIERDRKFTEMKLFNLDVEITEKCNLACRTCYNPISQQPQTMSLEQYSEVLQRGNDLVAYLGRDGLWITISGGEPLCNGAVWEIIAASKKHGARGIAVVTNGTLIDAATAVRFEASGVDEVMVSVDGATAATNDRIRGTNAFDRAMAGIRALRLHAPNVLVGATLTLTALNEKELQQYVNLMADLGVCYIWINPPVFCGRFVHSDLALPEHSHIDSMLRVRRLDIVNFRRGLSVYYNVPYYALSDPVSPYFDMATACPWGVNNLTVTCGGQILPCLYSRDLVLGNVFRDGLITAYEHPILQRFRDRTGLSEPCHSCSYGLFCGGCRARTYYLTGQWFAPDPWCPLVQGLTEEELRRMVITG